MNHYNRRKFLKTFALGTGVLFLPPVLFKSKAAFFAFNNSKEKEKLRKEALESFYRRQYNKAENLYQQWIELYPEDVSGYDGLAKVYSAQQENLAIVELYQSALDKNPDNPVFYDRLARAMNSLSLGNQKQEKIYTDRSGETFLIQSASLLYLQAIALSPDKKYLYDGLLDTTRCLEKKNKQLERLHLPPLVFSPEIAAQIESAASAYKENWNKTRKREKHRGKTTDNLSGSLSKMENKRRRVLYFEDEKSCREMSLSKKKKEFIYPFFVAALRAKQSDAAKDYYRQIKEAADTDIYSRHLLSKHYKKKKDYKQLADFWEKEDARISPYWQKINRARALVLEGEKTNNPSQIQQALEIYQEVQSNEELPERDTKAIAALYGGIAQCRFRQSRIKEGREALQAGLNHLPPTGGIAASLLINYAGSYDREQATAKAEKILMRLSGEKSVVDPSGDAFMDAYIQEREEQTRWEQKNETGKWRKKNREKGNRKQGKQRKRDRNPAIDNLQAAYALAKIYEKKSNTARYNEILAYIEKEDSDNEFVRKRRNKSRKH